MAVLHRDGGNQEIKTVLRNGLRFLAALATVAAIGMAASTDASARGHSHVFLGFNFGAPCCYYPHYYPYYAPAYYYPPPPPVVYAPPPVYYTPPPAVVAPSAPAPYCREYHGDATIDGQGQPFYGRACLQPDGRWHIVN